MHKIVNIDTELGNQILDDLKRQGWKQVKQYNIFAFDKGIDFDSYTLRKHKDKLYFEWDNWFEWEIVGPDNRLIEIAEQYQLTIFNGPES